MLIMSYFCIRIVFAQFYGSCACSTPVGLGTNQRGTQRRGLTGRYKLGSHHREMGFEDMAMMGPPGARVEPRSKT